MPSNENRYAPLPPPDGYNDKLYCYTDEESRDLNQNNDFRIFDIKTSKYYISTKDIPDEFKVVDYPEDHKTFVYGVSTHKYTLKTFIKDNKEVYSKLINIWPSYEQDPEIADYWFRHKIYKNHIILSDYYGIRIFNNKLEQKWHLKIPYGKVYDDVYGFKIIVNTLFLWSGNDVQDQDDNNIFDQYTTIPKKDEIITKYDLDCIFNN